MVNLFTKLTLFVVVPILAALVAYAFWEGVPLPHEFNSSFLDGTILPELTRFRQNFKSKENLNKKVLILLPEEGYDASEVVISWWIFSNEYKIKVHFSTPKGKIAKADPIPLYLDGLDPIMKFIFRLGDLSHSSKVVELYKVLETDPEYTSPIPWEEVNLNAFDGVWVPGGHAQEMKQLLESKLVQDKILGYWNLKKPIAAVCHGVILLARTIKEDGKSILYGKRSTSVNNFMERLAQLATSWRLGNYYRTYEESTEDEVKRALYGVNTKEEAKRLNDQQKLYDTGSFIFEKHEFDRPFGRAFIVEDENYISGRWPGDVHLLAHRLAFKILLEHH